MNNAAEFAFHEINTFFFSRTTVSTNTTNFMTVTAQSFSAMLHVKLSQLKFNVYIMYLSYSGKRRDYNHWLDVRRHVQKSHVRREC